MEYIISIETHNLHIFQTLYLDFDNYDILLNDAKNIIIDTLNLSETIDNMTIVKIVKNCFNVKFFYNQYEYFINIENGDIYQLNSNKYIYENFAINDVSFDTFRNVVCVFGDR